jgi:nicotinate-nucleotide adenylyltransferase
MSETEYKVAIYGGAFNPPTVAHEIVARTVHIVTGIHVWMIPCYQHMFGKEMVSPDRRLLMCQHTMFGQAGVTVKDFDIKKQFCGPSYDALAFYREQYKNAKFYLVMGADNFNIVPEKWYKGKELEAEYQFVLLKRPGHPFIRSIDEKHLLVDLKFPGLSSTGVRDAIAAGDHELAKRNVHPNVWKMIRKEKLYGYQELKI